MTAKQQAEPRAKKRLIGRVRLKFMGKQPIKIQSQPDVWINPLECRSFPAEQAVALVQRFPWKVVRDPMGMLGKVVDPIPQDNEGYDIGPAD